ncbi:saccharopine dehydrogenase NADP-binding domain-containing protein [Lysinibacillus endophyticus]|uniref:S-adenosylmethionine decarboxylase related protein n=1 Tax=Ureibacillus endophyticus TaxID=1978490 RepID=A0A494YZ76_9BACL|nr:saccharopine dehydrogenase NADP-binding domain-containing protein [Lysinibacillus endophyticus]MCP1144992.1 saccharopine dehydrogenase NADP-binding domain-containing protein [Lysinibacillus endophyticus]RKQ15499.1 S-adenosylmethionine decarboxylase related protein [Lysinibacillus endophyticus]
MTNRTSVLTLLGSAGGVAKAILAILNKSAVDVTDPIHPIITNCQLHLIDMKSVDKQLYFQLFPNLKQRFVFHQLDLSDKDKFIQHLKNTKTSLVIDVSWADTVEMMKACNSLGISYVNSALENPYIDENEDQFAGFGLIERLNWIEGKRHLITNSKAILCSGMNPGVVQWMATELFKNKPTNETPLACFIVEHDNSFFKDKTLAKENVVYTTWSPECFLDEAILSYPMFMKGQTPLFLYENVYDLEFKVRLGDIKFYGCLMPHEEVYTLGKLLNLESGFIYKVNEHTTKLIRSNIDDVDKIWDFEMKVLNPLDGELVGEDLCGVLMVYPDKEQYMYNVLTNIEIFDKFQMNATYFQVACGIYASLSVLLLDDIPKGAHYVDELLLNHQTNFGQYLKQYMKDFVVGENDKSDGLILDRMRDFKD